MTKTSLQNYDAQVKKLLDQQAFDEAIQWAQHLLRTYPKFIQGYQMLAEAALEHGDLREAADLFRRVLSADPENFMAHAGLSMIYTEEGILDEALWQMMRAFELAPANGEI